MYPRPGCSLHSDYVARSPQGAPYVRQIADAIQAQTARMDQAAQEARRKRALEAEANEAVKRTKLESVHPPTPPNVPPVATPQAATVAQTPIPASAFANFDFSTLPLPLVVDILVANLQALPDERLTTAITVSYMFIPVVFNDSVLI